MQRPPSRRVADRRRSTFRLPVRWLAAVVVLAALPVQACSVSEYRSDALDGPVETVPPPTGGPLRLTVMTYNVLGGPVPDDWFTLSPRDELSPNLRAPGVVAKVELADPDIIGFQEFASSSESGGYIEQRLAGYTWLHSDGEHAMLVRKSRFDVLANGTERISTLGELGSMFDRYADWVRLRDIPTGRTLVAVNVHQHPFQQPAFAAVRSAAIDRLLAAIERLDPGLADPLVLLGDFNASSAERRPVYGDHLTKLGAVGIVDARTLARRDDSDVPGASSLHQMSAKVADAYVAKVVRRSNRYIDYVWVPEGTRVASWAVLSGPGVEWRRIRGRRVPTWTGVIPSDHSPVVASLRFD